MSRHTQETTPNERLGFVYGAFTLCGPAFQPGSTHLAARTGDRQIPTSRPYNPAVATTAVFYTAAVWALPRSLAATKGITVVFSSSRYLDVSVPSVRLPRPMYSAKG